MWLLAVGVHKAPDLETSPDDDGELGLETSPDDDGELDLETSPDDDGELDLETSPDDDGELGLETSPDDDGEPGLETSPDDDENSVYRCRWLVVEWMIKIRVSASLRGWGARPGDSSKRYFSVNTPNLTAAGVQSGV